MMGVRLQTQTKTAATRAPSFTPVRTGLLQRKSACGGCAKCRQEELTVQRRAADQAKPSTVPPIVRDVLRSSGQPLDEATRAFMEPRFGHDFGQLRVHTDARAAESARAVNALAYTVGRDVVFGAGQHALNTTEGKRLLAHELTHVAQQGSAIKTKPNLVIGPADDAYEREADQVASQVGTRSFNQRVSSGVHAQHGNTIRLQRQLDPATAPTPAGPAPAGPTPASPTLATGQVVNVEIRDAGGAVTDFSHEYPIDAAGNIEIPTAGTIAASGKTLVQFRQAIHNTFSPNILVNPTVNVSLSSKTIKSTQKIGVGDTVHSRVLQGNGKVDPSSGAYTVDSAGKLHLPFIGDIDAAGKTIAELEDLIEKGIRNGFILNAVVHVSMTQLNS